MKLLLDSASPLPRLLEFMHSVFPLRLYGTYAVLWVLALEGTLAVVAPYGHWSIDEFTAARVLTVWLMLFYLRIVDEQKDLEYDRVHNPNRPLVRGAISVGELRLAMLGIALLLLMLNLGQPPWVSALVLLNLTYALFLMAWEKRSTWFSESLLINLLATYPVQLLLSVYLVLSHKASSHETASTGQAVLLVAAFACAFLHLEFARKTVWQAEPGKRLYSERLGPRGSAGVALLLALSAELLAFAARPGGTGWTALLPWLALVFPLAGARRFLSRRVAQWPKEMALGFLLFFYGSLILVAGLRTLAD